MVKAFIILLLALGVGAYLSVLLTEDPGYVLVTFRDYSIEATLAAAVISLCIFYVLFFGVIKLLKIVNPFKLFSSHSFQYFSLDLCFFHLELRTIGQIVIGDR